MNLGVRAGVDHVVLVGSRLAWSGVQAGLVPTSFYGEGLRRAFARFSRPAYSPKEVLTGPVWRGRLLLLAFLAVSPVLLLGVLAAAAGVSHRLGTGTGPRLLGIYLAFLTGWTLLSVLLAFGYRALAPAKLGGRALAWGAGSTRSFLAGMVLGRWEEQFPVGGAARSRQPPVGGGALPRQQPVPHRHRPSGLPRSLATPCSIP